MGEDPSPISAAMGGGFVFVDERRIRPTSPAEASFTGGFSRATSGILREFERLEEDLFESFLPSTAETDLALMEGGLPVAG